MKNAEVYFFKNDTFYATEHTEVPDDVPCFEMREWFHKKYAHQYSGMSLVAHGEDIVPVMISGARRA